MYCLDDCPTDTILREIQFRLDAMRGCVLRAYDVEELVRELRDRAGGRPGEIRGLSLRKVASLYGRVLRAKYNIRGLAEVDRWTPVTLSEVLSQEPSAPADADLAGAFLEDDDRLDDATAKAEAEADLREAVTALYRVHGIRGARAFVDWFAGQATNREAEVLIADQVALIEVEHDPHDPAPEKAWLWFRDRDGLERSVRVGTVRRWLKAAHDASDSPSDEPTRPRQVWYKKRAMSSEATSTLMLLPKCHDAERYAVTVRAIIDHLAANNRGCRLPERVEIARAVRWVREELSNRSAVSAAR